jgi:hypothetical protein
MNSLSTCYSGDPAVFCRRDTLCRGISNYPDLQFYSNRSSAFLLSLFLVRVWCFQGSSGLGFRSTPSTIQPGWATGRYQVINPGCWLHSQVTAVRPDAPGPAGPHLYPDSAMESLYEQAPDLLWPQPRMKLLRIFTVCAWYKNQPPSAGSSSSSLWALGSVPQQTCFMVPFKRNSQILQHLPPFIFSEVCVCEHEHMCVHVHACGMHVHVCTFCKCVWAQAWGAECTRSEIMWLWWPQAGLRNSPHFYLIRWWSRVFWSNPQLTYMGSIRPALGISCLYLPRLDAQTSHQTQPGFTWASGIQTPILMLEWQVLWPQSFLLSSLCSVPFSFISKLLERSLHFYFHTLQWALNFMIPDKTIKITSNPMSPHWTVDSESC